MRHSIRRMPELPDVVVYIEALERRIGGARLERVRLLSPFVLRSVDPPLPAAAGRTGTRLPRLGKPIAIGLKRALTDARLFSGIGNAYSDEILHRACLSPVKLSQQLADEEIRRLFEATRATLLDWCERLRREAGDGFPEGVTAFREGMAVHGRYGKPCPACGAPVQRIVHVENATNYCARCQTGGRLLADRALSRLLKEDWPRTLEELEERRGTSDAAGERSVARGAWRARRGPTRPSVS